MSETPKFSLLQRVRNTVASESNPHRDGWFLRTITRPHGRMNSGRWAVVLHADGTESHTPPENLVPITEEAGAMSDHPRDCPHGRQWGKCDTCDLIEASAEIAALKAGLERWVDKCYEADERKNLLLEENADLEAENERLRHDAEQWRKHEYGVARACEQGMADLARLAALDEEAGE